MNSFVNCKIDTMSTPQVSVLIPTYNAELYISEAIQSVLAQTFTDFELIIVDNASTDNTKGVVEKYLFDNRVVYIRNEYNIGMAGNWNKCLLYAKGKYVKFLMADDIFYPTILEKFVNIFESYPSVSLVTSYKKIFGSVNIDIKLPFDGLQSGIEMIKDSILKGNWIGEPTTVMFKRNNLWVGGFNLNLGYILDWDMWIRILNTGDLYIVPECLAAFRMHDSQATYQIKAAYKDLFEDYYYLNYLSDFYFTDFVDSQQFKDRKRTSAIKCANLAFVLYKEGNMLLAKQSYKIGLREGLVKKIITDKILYKLRLN